MQILMGLLNDKRFVVEYSVNDMANQLENLFFVHPQSLAIWQAFPHVLIVDATYKTNGYGMPFVEMVGVTSTNKTFSIAFAFIINEREENYTWALTCLMLTLDECMHPRIILTDRDLALLNACQRVFPNSARLLCRWHITENIRKNCRHGEDEWLNVRRQLLHELESKWDVYARVFTDGIHELHYTLSFFETPAPPQYWMIMPETSVLIANRFGVILTFLTSGGSLTFFPLWKGPGEFLYHKNITISLVYGGYYVMVQLKEDCPMPPISAYWIRHRAPCAAGWETMFMSRLQFYRQLKPCNPDTHFITIEDC